MRKEKDYSVIEGIIRQTTDNPIKQSDNVNGYDNVFPHVSNTSGSNSTCCHGTSECNGSTKSPIRDESQEKVCS